MPLILERGDEAGWLDPSVTADQALAFAACNANGSLIREPVSRSVNNTRNQGPECIELVDPDRPDPEPGALF